MIVLFIGLPGAGKTSIAGAVSDRVNGLHINEDEVRNGFNNNSGCTQKDIIEQARLMGEIARHMDRKKDGQMM